MTKRIAALLCGCALGMGGVLPAFALDGDEVAKSLSASTWRLSVFGVGTVIGTPIAVVRKVVDNTMSTTSDMAGKSENTCMKAAAPLVGVPVGLFTGGLEGLWWGPKNAWNNRIEHPFSFDTISLGEMKD